MIQWCLFCSLTGTSHEEISLDSFFADCSTKTLGVGEVAVFLTEAGRALWIVP